MFLSIVKSRKIRIYGTRDAIKLLTNNKHLCDPLPEFNKLIKINIILCINYSSIFLYCRTGFFCTPDT